MPASTLHQLIRKLEGEVKASELEGLKTQAIAEAIRAGYPAIAQQIGQIEFRTQRDFGRFGSFRDLRDSQELNECADRMLTLVLLLQGSESERGEDEPPRSGWEFADALRKAYERVDWTQAVLAERTGISQPQISRIVRRVQNPQASTRRILRSFILAAERWDRGQPFRWNPKDGLLNSFAE